MNLGDKQELSHVEDSTALQAGHDINLTVQGTTVPDVIAIVKYVVASELAIYSQQADVKAEQRLAQFSNDLDGKLAEKVAGQLNRFNEPSLQFAVREAALGYIKSGSPEDEENLIDLMIERVKVEEHSTKQKLIDQAIKIVPTLSAESLAMLSILAFRQLTLVGNKTEYVKWLKSINGVVEIAAKASFLDIEYLIQAGCATGMLGLKKFITWEQTCLQSADLFYRHPLPDEAVKAFFNSIGIIPIENGGGFSTVKSGEEAQKLLLFIAITMVALPEMKVGFNLVSSSSYSDTAQKQGLEYVIQPFLELRDSANPFTTEEVIRYFEGLNPNWRKVINLLDNEQISTLKLTPMGAYIGSRQLSQLSNREIPLEIFYK